MSNMGNSKNVINLPSHIKNSKESGVSSKGNGSNNKENRGKNEVKKGEGAVSKVPVVVNNNFENNSVQGRKVENNTNNTVRKKRRRRRRGGNGSNSNANNSLKRELNSTVKFAGEMITKKKELSKKDERVLNIVALLLGRTFKGKEKDGSYKGGISITSKRLAHKFYETHERLLSELHIDQSIPMNSILGEIYSMYKEKERFRKDKTRTYWRPASGYVYLDSKSLKPKLFEKLSFGHLVEAKVAETSDMTHRGIYFNGNISTATLLCKSLLQEYRKRGSIFLEKVGLKGDTLENEVSEVFRKVIGAAEISNEKYFDEYCFRLKLFESKILQLKATIEEYEQLIPKYFLSNKNSGRKSRQNKVDAYRLIGRLKIFVNTTKTITEIMHPNQIQLVNLFLYVSSHLLGSDENLLLRATKNNEVREFFRGISFQIISTVGICYHVIKDVVSEYESIGKFNLNELLKGKVGLKGENVSKILLSKEFEGGVRSYVEEERKLKEQLEHTDNELPEKREEREVKLNKKGPEKKENNVNEENNNKNRNLKATEVSSQLETKKITAKQSKKQINNSEPSVLMNRKVVNNTNNRNIKPKKLSKAQKRKLNSQKKLNTNKKSRKAQQIINENNNRLKGKAKINSSLNIETLVKIDLLDEGLINELYNKVLKGKHKNNFDILFSYGKEAHLKMNHNQVINLARVISKFMERKKLGSGGAFLKQVMGNIHKAHNSKDTGSRLPSHYIDLLRQHFIIFGIFPRKNWEPKKGSDFSAMAKYEKRKLRNEILSKKK